MRSLPVWAVLSLFAFSSCAVDPSSKRKDGDKAAPNSTNAASADAEKAPTITEDEARAKRPGMIIARVPVGQLGSEDFNNAEFVVVDKVTETRFKNDLAKAYEFASAKESFSSEDQVALSFRQQVKTADGLELCGGCGHGGGYRVGLFGFIGGVFHGVGRLVGGILHGAGAVVAGAVHGAAGIVHGVGDLLYQHRPVFTGWGWEYEYECGGYTDINDYRYYQYEPGTIKGTPSQVPFQQPLPPSPIQQPVPPIHKPVPPPAPIGKVIVDPTEPCPYGCPK